MLSVRSSVFHDILLSVSYLEEEGVSKKPCLLTIFHFFFFCSEGKSRSDVDASKKVSARRQSSQYGYRAKSAANYSRGPNRLRQQPRAYPG